MHLSYPETLGSRGCPARLTGGGVHAAKGVGHGAGDGGAGEHGEEAAGEGAGGVTWVIVSCIII